MASESAKELFDAVQKGDVAAVKHALRDGGVDVNALDEHGMTPLQHAAYRANRDLCALLLDRGADVNSNRHDHGYTALMFAALSGNADATALLLDAGASTTARNSVGRNAAQMAAFVGNHACVAVISNYVPVDVVSYYTVPRGLEKEPKLPPRMLAPFRRFVLHGNVHPVAVARRLQQSPALYAESDRVVRVLDLMCERELKCPETNEVLALKFHYLAFILRYCCDAIKSRVDNDKTCEDRSGFKEEEVKTASRALDDLMRRFLKGRSGDGFPECPEKLVRQCIREFPDSHCPIVQQFVHTLAKVKIGDEPSALSLVTSAVSGRRAAADDDAQCTACGQFQVEKRCSACKSVFYCDQKCQKLHWSEHKKQCGKLSERAREMEKESTETGDGARNSEGNVRE